MLKPDFSKTGDRFAETGFLPIIKKLLCTDDGGMGIRKGANLSAKLEYSFCQN